MYEDLAPYAMAVHSAAVPLLFFSAFYAGTLEGMFGLIAASGVLCCAAPGSLGVAHAAKCTRICALIAAMLALIHIFCITTFALFVMPEMPKAFHQACVMNTQQELGLIAAAPVHSNLWSNDAAPSADAAVAPIPAAHEEVALVKDDDKDVFTATQEFPKATHAEGIAVFTASVSTTAVRRLQEYYSFDYPEVTEEEPAKDDNKDEPSMPTDCEHAERMFAKAAPIAMMLSLLVEFGLFTSALRVAKASARIVLAARSFGANGI